MWLSNTSFLERLQNSSKTTNSSQFTLSNNLMCSLFFCIIRPIFLPSFIWLIFKSCFCEMCFLQERTNWFLLTFRHTQLHSENQVINWINRDCERIFHCVLTHSKHEGDTDAMQWIDSELIFVECDKIKLAAASISNAKRKIHYRLCREESQKRLWE